MTIEARTLENETKTELNIKSKIKVFVSLISIVYQLNYLILERTITYK